MSLYPRHIETEDRRFFLPVMDYFTEQEQEDMLLDFNEFDRTMIHRKYESLVEGLEGPGKEEVKTGRKISRTRRQCKVCDYVYDPAQGDQEGGTPPGIDFKDLPDDWVCPVCGADKEAFVRLD